jgi:hypothetical protein
LTREERRKWLDDYQRKLRGLIDSQDKLDGRARRDVRRLVRDAQKVVISRTEELARQAEGSRSEWGVFWTGRLRQMLVGVATDLAGKTGESIASYLPDSFRNGVDIADSGVAGLGLDVPGLAPQTIQVASSFSADLIQGLAQKSVDLVSREIAVSVALGESPWLLMQRLGAPVSARDESVFGSVAYQAERIARTEISRVQSLATQLRQEQVVHTYPEAGLKRIYLCAHILDWPCDICSPYDQQVFGIDDQDAPVLPQHPNCRCVYADHIPGLSDKISTAMALAGLNGKP